MKTRPQTGKVRARTGLVLFLLIGYVIPVSPANPQTFTPTQAVSGTICRDRLGLTRSCTDITTDRITQQYTQSQMGRKLFGMIGGMATNCLRTDPNQANDCAYTLSVWTDPVWGRVVYGLPDRWLKAFGSSGMGSGQFLEPMGAALTNRHYNGYGVFVADPANDRVAVLMIQIGSETMSWLAQITGEESGTRLKRPTSVVWDPVGTKPTNNDRIFILDSGNGRVLVYNINFDLLSGTFTKTYVGQFGARGTGNRQLLNPTDIAVRSWRGYSPAGYSDVAHVVIADNGNKRVARWEYVLSDPYTPGPRVGGVFETFPLQDADIAGVTMDHYGDIIAADRSRNLLLKYDRNMNLVVSYGGTASWATGSFSGPSTPRVVYTYGDPSGSFIEAGMAYVGTAERWTDQSGVQLHRIGSDLINMTLTKNDSARTATSTFVLTAGGSYLPYIINSAGTIVRMLDFTITESGVRLVHWDGYLDNGTRALGGVDYRLAVQYLHGYAYDQQGQGRIAYSPAFRFPGSVPPPMVAIIGPTVVDPFVSTEWSASVDGMGPFSYYWTRDGYAVGTGSSYWGSAAYCYGFDLALTVTDAVGQSRSDSRHVYSSMEGTQSCNPGNCPPQDLDCDVEPQAAPPTYEFAQDYQEGSGGSSFRSMPSLSLNGIVGLSRGSPPFAPTNTNATQGMRDRSATVKAIRERGITHLRFGVPRASEKAATRARTAAPNQEMELSRVRPNGAPSTAPASAPRGAGAGRDGASDNVSVAIQIYDMGGRLVRTAVRATLEPGYYEYEWDGRNDAGLPMPPGVYVAVMSAPSFAHRTKLILAR
jgi:flagellar hook assembly protein FlgD